MAVRFGLVYDYGIAAGCPAHPMIPTGIMKRRASLHRVGGVARRDAPRLSQRECRKAHAAPESVPSDSGNFPLLPDGTWGVVSVHDISEDVPTEEHIDTLHRALDGTGLPVGAREAVCGCFSRSWTGGE